MPGNAEMIGIVGRLSKQNKLIISGKDATIENDPKELMKSIEQEIACNVSIEESIINRRVVAAVDASIDERFMVACWVITTLEER